MTIRDRIKDFRRVPASSLRPNAKNWRVHSPAQRQALQAMFQEVGIAGACLAREGDDGQLVLIDGHLRQDELAGQEVPVLVLDVTEAEADQLLVSFDPLGAMADADAESLNALLQDVQTSDGALTKMLSDLAANAQTKSIRGDSAAGSAGDTECEYPLTPVPGEKYDYVLIFCDNESDYANLQTVLKITPRADYKSKAVAPGRVIRYREFKQAIEEWAKHGTHGGHPVGRPGGAGQDAQGDLG